MPRFQTMRQGKYSPFAILLALMPKHQPFAEKLQKRTKVLFIGLFGPLIIPRWNLILP
jgi:hypothetical protein